MGKNTTKNESANTVKNTQTPANAARSIVGVSASLKIATTPMAKFTFPSNSIVLLKATDTTWSYGYVTGLRNTEDITLMRHLVNAIAAESEVASNFKVAYHNSTDENILAAEKNDLTPVRLLLRFLSGNVVYKTDSNGKLSKAVVSDVALRQTALGKLINGRAKFHELNRDQKRAACNTYASAILAQCKAVSAVNKTLAEFLADANDTTPSAKRSRKTAQDAQNIVDAAK